MNRVVHQPGGHVKHTIRRSTLVRVIAIGAALGTLAACGDAPDETTPGSTTTGTTESSTPSATAADFQACLGTDSGGIDDRAFNATAWKGLEDAEDQLGITAKYVESNADSDYAPNVQQMVVDDCGIIVTVGFLLGDATKAAAEANPDENFSIVDYSYDPPVTNIKPLVFDTAQAAFLGGYVAAAMTKTGKVATFGGINIPTVSIFMDGFADGIAYHNEKKGTKVELLGWNVDSQDGSFTGDFQDQNKGRQLTQNFIDQGADIIFPVAGPVGLGAAAAAQETDGAVNLIWVDTDGYVSAPDYKGLFITSVVKKIDNAVLAATEDATNNAFTGDAYIGTLDNEGVDIAPFHDFESKLPAGLQAELDEIRAGIVSGEIEVTSPSSPK
jgi:basic membrane protein A